MTRKEWIEKLREQKEIFLSLEKEVEALEEEQESYINKYVKLLKENCSKKELEETSLNIFKEAPIKELEDKINNKHKELKKQQGVLLLLFTKDFDGKV